MTSHIRLCLRPSIVFGALTTLVSTSVLGTAARTARADDSACFAASEAEIGLKKDGKLRDAIKQLVVCAAPSCPSEVSAECARRLLALNAALPTVVLVVTDAAGNDVAAATVTVDGAPFASKIDGVAIPIDPGSHTLHFAPATGAPIDKTVIIREGEKDRKIAVTIGGAAPAAAPTAAPAPIVGGLPSSATDVPPPPSSWNTQKTLAVVAAGVGVVGVGVGTVFGIMALSDASAVKTDCPAGSCSAAGHASALSDHSSASTAGDVSTAMFIVGGVGLAAGAALWFTAPHGEAPTKTGLTIGPFELDPLVGPRGGAMAVRGRFE